MKKKFIYVTGLVATITLIGGAVAASGSAENAATEASAVQYFLSEDTIETKYGEKDSRDLYGATVTVSGLSDKGETQIEYANYIKREDLKNGFLTMSFEKPAVYGSADFDYLLIELSDALNTEEKLVWAVAPQPETCSWWNVWTSAWVSGVSELEATTRAAWTYPAMLKIAGTDQTIYAINNSYINQWNSLYEAGAAYYDAGYNFGKKEAYFTKPSDSSVMNSFTFALKGTKATINNTLIADVSNTEWLQKSGKNLVGTAYEDVYNEERMSNLFTSGYCTLKIRYMGLQSDRISCHIKNIGGQNLTSSAEAEIKNGTPYIEILQTTHAVSGYEFSVPKAKILDMREGDISARADYEFFDKNDEKVEDNGNGILFPEAGTYTMRCNITLKGGETFQTEKQVICYEKMPDTEFFADISFNDSYFTGETIGIPRITAKNLLSPEKNYAVNPVLVLQNNGAEVAKFNPAEYSYYTIQAEGNYTLACFYENDYGVVDALVYSFKAEKAVAIKPEFLPVSFANGGENYVADCSLINYANGTDVSEIYRAVYIGEEQIYLAKGNQVISGALNFRKNLSGESVMLSYKAGFSKESLAYSKSYEIPVHGTKYAEDYVIISDKCGNYARNNAKSILSDEAVIFEITEDTTFSLPQRMAADQLELLFDVMAGGKFGQLNLVLSDYLNPSKQIVLSAKPSGNGTVLYVNGKAAGNVGTSFDSDSDYFHIVYECDEKNNRFLTANGSVLTSKIAKIAEWSDGTSFNGYSDGTLTVKFEVREVSGATKFMIRRVNNQGFYTEKIGDNKQQLTDIFAPVLSIGGEYKTHYGLGERITLVKAAAYDVLQAKSNVTLTVEKPDGSVYYHGTCDTDQKLLLNAYGKWIVTYSANDGNELFSAEERFVLNVEDTASPVISVLENLPETLTLGQTYEFPGARVFDNVTQNCKVYVIVCRPDAMREAVVNNTYIFDRKGLYRVMYYATDESMNVAIRSFDIWVE